MYSEEVAEAATFLVVMLKIFMPFRFSRTQ